MRFCELPNKAESLSKVARKITRFLLTVITHYCSRCCNKNEVFWEHQFRTKTYCFEALCCHLFSYPTLCSIPVIDNLQRLNRVQVRQNGGILCLSIHSFKSGWLAIESSWQAGFESGWLSIRLCWRTSQPGWFTVRTWLAGWLRGLAG